MSGKLHIELLGGFRLDYGGEQLTTAITPRLQELMAWLVLHRDAPNPASTLPSCFGRTAPKSRPKPICAIFCTNFAKPCQMLTNF